MKKLLQMKTMLLLCALIVGSGSVWAEEETFTFGKTDRDVNSTSAVKKGDVTVTVTQNGAANAPNFTSDASDVRFQAGNKMSIVSSGVITKVVLSYTSAAYAAKITASSFNVGSYSYTSGQTTGTWTGSTSSLEIVNKESSQSRISQIVVTYTTAPSYTITGQSNNNSWGTVSKSGSVITASPADGYRVSKTTPYTVSPAESATVVQNGNEFTVTPSANTTVTIYFEAIPTRTLTMASNNDSYGSATADDTSILEEATTIITATPEDGYRFVNWSVEGEGSSVETATATSTTFTMGSEDATVIANFEAIPSHTLSYAITPDEAGTVTLGATSVREGDYTTIEATPNSGYIFKKWSVAGTCASITDVNSASTTFTMGTANATVTAEFAPLYTIKWSVNGEIVKTETLETGTSLTALFPDVSNIGVKTFVGWVTSSTVAADFKGEEFVTIATATADANTIYYAVFADKESDIVTDDLTRATTGVTGTSYSDWSGKTVSTGAVYAGQSAGGNDAIQLRTKNNNSGVVTTASGGKAKKVVVAWGNATAEGRTLDVYGKNTAYSTAADLYDANKQGTLLGSIVNGTSTLNITGDYEYIGVRSSADPMYINTLSITWNVEVYSNYTTIVTKTYTVSTNTDRYYGSYVTANKLDFKNAEGITAYIAEGFNNSKNAIVLQEVDVVPAGTAIIVKTDEKGGSADVEVTNDEASDVSENALVAGDGTTAWDGTDGYTYYYLASDLFHKATSGTLQSGKAYLKVANGDVPAGAHSFGFIFDEEEATGINTVAKDAENGHFFNLAGQRVAQPTKGLYIVNGRKVIVK